MLKYRDDLKQKARKLRSSMTDAEQRLWYRLRRKQILGIQFYRQKPIGNYIVDFFGPAVNLAIEVDGAQHFEDENMRLDTERTIYLNALGIRVIRFDNHQVLTRLDDVVAEVYGVIAARIPPTPPFSKGGETT